MSVASAKKTCLIIVSEESVPERVMACIVPKACRRNEVALVSPSRVGADVLQTGLFASCAIGSSSGIILVTMVSSGRLCADAGLRHGAAPAT